MNDEVKLFVSGGQFVDWLASNCLRCRKYQVDPARTCRLEYAISSAWCKGGSAPIELAKRAGLPSREIGVCQEIEFF